MWFQFSLNQSLKSKAHPKAQNWKLSRKLYNRLLTSSRIPDSDQSGEVKEERLINFSIVAWEAEENRRWERGQRAIIDENVKRKARKQEFSAELWMRTSIWPSAPVIQLLICREGFVIKLFHSIGSLATSKSGKLLVTLVTCKFLFSQMKFSAVGLEHSPISQNSAE
jgi:hypothetical protein